MVEIPNIDEQLSLELEPEDLTQVKNIVNTKEPIESVLPTPVTDSLLKGFFPGEYFYRSYFPLSLIEGTSQSDLLFDTPNRDLILAKGGNDYVIAWRGGNDLIYGEDGNDFIYAGDGNDRTYGGNGNDRIYGGSGNDSMYGDSTPYSLYLYFLLTTNHSDLTSLNSQTTDISQLPSGDSSSLIFPYPDPSSGDDSMYGGSGNDYMEGGSGDDSMYGDFNPFSFLLFFNPFTLAKLSSGNSSSLISPDPYPYIDTKSGDDSMYGGAGNDSMYGGGGNNRMYGGSGDDYMHGDSDHSQSFIYPDFYSYPRSGDDYMNGGSGDDYMNGGHGNDSIDGGNDDDLIYGGSGDDYMNGGSGNDYMNGGSGRDYMNGGSGDDIIVGNNRRRMLLAKTNIDSMTGLTENPVISDVTLTRDSLTIEPSLLLRSIPMIDRDQDRLTGGQGADKFVFYSPDGGIDIITDFNISQGDQIQVSRYDFDGELSYGQLKADQFTLGVSATDANDRFIYNSQTGDLFFDADGVGGQVQVQFAKLSGNPSLTSSDIFVI